MLIWRFSHDIPINALNDPLFHNDIGDKILKSSKVNREMSNQMPSKILELSFKKIRGQYISLILDGETKSHIKWLTIGFMYRKKEHISFQLLDDQVF